MMPLFFESIKESGYINAHKLRSAEHLLVQMEQQKIFSRQFLTIKSGTKEKLKDKLGLYEKSGLFRCAGR